VSASLALTRGTQTLALLAAALVGVQVGAATVASRFALPETDPVSLGFMRYAIGALSLLPFVLAAPRPKFQTRDLLPMAALGIVQFAILILLLNVGLTHIPAGRAALVFSAFPLLTMLLGAALGREAMTARKTTGVVLTMFGVGLALGDKIFGDRGLGGAGTSLWGEALVLGAALCGAICSVLYRPYLVRYPALPVAGFAMAATVVFLACLGVVRGGLTNPLAMSGRALAAVVFIGLSSGIAYFVLLWAYARVTPTRVTTFQALAPLTATALGVMFLGESVTWNFLAGLAAVATGIVVALSAAPQRA
jgi:drug/metabolite transporter (DMT)-like permease